MSDTTTQISKIQIRRGPASDLPGEPTSGNPTLPTTGLDSGEMAFTIDTGQLYVGIDPMHTAATLGRAIYPYQNIEVLTETSTATVQQMVGQYMRLQNQSHYQSQPLNIASSVNDSDWSDLMIVNGASDDLYVTLGTSNDYVCAKITYFLYDSNAAPMRAGTMTVISNPNVQTPLLTDESTHYPRTDLTPTNARDPNQVYGSVQFQAAIVGNGTASQVVIQYQNNSQTTPFLMFRIEMPTV